MKKLIIILLGLFIATLVFVPVSAQVKIAADGSVQPTGNFAAMHGEYVDGVVLAKDTSDIPSYMLIPDSTYTYFNNVVYAYDGSKWNSLEVVLPDSILYESDTVDILATKYQLDTALLLGDLFTYSITSGNEILATKPSKFSETNGYSFVFGDGMLAIGYTNGNYPTLTAGGSSIQFNDRIVSNGGTYKDIGAANGNCWGDAYVEKVKLRLNEIETSLGAQNRQLIFNDTTIQNYIRYYSPAIFNIEDDGVNVVNSASGTGHFQWENIRLDDGNIWLSPGNTNNYLKSGELASLGNSGKLKLAGGATNKAFIEIGGIFQPQNNGIDLVSDQGGISFGSDASRNLYGNIDASNGGWTIDSLIINSEYAFPITDGSAGQVLQTDGNGQLSFQDASGGLVNLEDDGTGVVNSASGTGTFQWGNTIIDQQNILPATTGVGTVGSSSKRWDIVATENLNLQTFSSNQTLVTSFVSFAPANGETSLDLGTGSQPWDIGYFNSLGSSSTGGHDSIDFRNNRISSVADPIYPPNAANKGYVDGYFDDGTFTATYANEGGSLSSHSGIYTVVDDVITINLVATFGTNAIAQPLQITLPFSVDIQNTPAGSVVLNGLVHNSSVSSYLISAYILTTGTRSLIRVDKFDGTDIQYDDLDGLTVSITGSFKCADCTP